MTRIVVWKSNKSIAVFETVKNKKISGPAHRNWVVYVKTILKGEATRVSKSTGAEFKLILAPTIIVSELKFQQAFSNFELSRRLEFLCNLWLYGFE